MNRQILERFQGKIVKLVITPNFCLTGTIDMVHDDCIVFSTFQKTSVIRFDRIQEVTPV